MAVNYLKILDTIRECLGDKVVDTYMHANDANVVVKPEALLEACKFLRDENSIKMDYLADVCGTDYHPATPRFEVVYHMLSTTHKSRLRLKIRVNDGVEVDSVCSVWKSANWYERETYDMFGIVFKNHPDLRRIYLAEDWEGYPLRKDYPLRGYKDELNPFGEEKK